MLDTSYIIIGSRGNACYNWLPKHTLSEVWRAYLWRRLIMIYSIADGYVGSHDARDAVVNDVNVINTVILLPSLLLLLLSLL